MVLELRFFRGLLIGVLIACGPCLAFGDTPFDPFAAAGIDIRQVGAALPRDLAFIDQQGRSVRVGDLLDKRPLLLVPVYFRCPNVCGAALSNLFSQLANVPYTLGADYQVIAFSFDPREHDDAAREELAKLVSHWPKLAHDPALHLLTGTADNSAALARALGFGFRFDDVQQQYAHSSAVAAITGDGRLSRWLYGLGYQASDVRLALTEAGQGRLGAVTEQLLLLCYHYDPSSGLYSSRIIFLLQIAGSGLVLVMGLFIGGSLLGERKRRRLQPEARPND
ncbi:MULTISPECIES: SCO family protein [unclassified Pseudomonas]|uniref:SCO family protein n=1 Tax=unclassified Pseudomonas TaxID=196821 RepID=UPI002AC9D5F2|nr:MULTISPECIES: SCO family protein [unclassified Pseudomonas]MEB0040035.1 SCO family protein [Pseudomonas sp. MH10]MEB0076433.1 SCO family protein [Pseudomonas sp. MH10out]MEB0091218.1 SCO family protein [Pseudomonas sp. CCI4.2]MEB0100828.1 SCO family protein [Pseudomonas sp. CCI3.2]MEB0119560.1 SCO family protein [Pseudomonas sp. CCI1.2]